jgi:hypothetical protein
VAQIIWGQYIADRKGRTVMIASPSKVRFSFLGWVIPR